MWRSCGVASGLALPGLAKVARTVVALAGAFGSGTAFCTVPPELAGGTNTRPGDWMNPRLASSDPSCAGIGAASGKVASWRIMSAKSDPDSIARCCTATPPLATLCGAAAIMPVDTGLMGARP